MYWNRRSSSPFTQLLLSTVELDVVELGPQTGQRERVMMLKLQILNSFCPSLNLECGSFFNFWGQTAHLVLPYPSDIGRMKESF